MIKSWWERLTRGAQKKYISEHPESIYSKKVKSKPSGSVQRSDESKKVQMQIQRNKLLHLHQRYRRLVAQGASKDKMAKLLAKMAIVKSQLSKLH